MYVSDTYRSRVCRYIDLDDREFFQMALDRAIRMQPEVANISRDTAWLKSHCPIAHISTLSPAPVAAEHEVDRLYVHTARARRRFLMGDVDFDADEVAESREMWRALKRFAEKHRTPLMLYPTLSYPEKPRYRFVFLVDRPLSPSRYGQAMTWLYDQLGFEPTDTSDMRITMNRNLPLFATERQVKGVWSTFSDESLEPLDNDLWKNAPAYRGPTGIVSASYKPPSDLSGVHALKFDAKRLVEAAGEYAHDEKMGEYRTFWPVVNSFAAAVAAGGISEACAVRCMRALAGAAGDDRSKRQRWAVGNEQMLYDAMRSMNDEKMADARPLAAIDALAVALADD